MAEELKRFLPEIVDNIKNKNSGFFVGAGLSIGAGLPTWQGLLDSLIGIAESIPHFDKEKIADYKKLSTDPTKFLFLAEDIKSELGNSYYQFMENTFGRPDITPTETHAALMEIPVSLIITLNYDRLLENAFIRKYGHTPNSYIFNQSRPAANSFWKGNFFILKAHGDANVDVENLILSQRDYRLTLYKENGYRSLLQSIFTTKSLIFIGVSLNDPEFNQILDYLHDSYHGGGPTHYLITEETSIPSVLKKRYKEDFEIQTITYKNNSGTHQEIKDILIEIKNAIL